MPLDPYWGYTTSTNAGYQYASSSSRDFEIHQSDEVDLVVKILGYAGVIIKDPSIVQAASQEENKIKSIPGAKGLSPNRSAIIKDNAWDWATNIWEDMLG